MLKFTDGEKFNTEGKIRLERRRDGYYIVGKGMLIPVDSREIGLQMIKEMEGDK